MKWTLISTGNKIIATLAAVWTVYKAVKKSSPWGLGVGRYKYLGGWEAAEILGGLEVLGVSWGLEGLRGPGDPEGPGSLEGQQCQ